MPMAWQRWPPVRSSLPTVPKPSSSSPTAGTTMLAGVRLGWRMTDVADAVPVVALHGMCSTSKTWDKVAARLSEHGRRTIALDLRGHGRSSRPGTYSCSSMRDDVIAFLDEAGLQQVDLLGHSLGGHVAMLVAQQAPRRVRRLVLEDVPPPPVSTKDSTIGSRRQRAVLAVQSVLLLSRLRRFDVRMTKPVLTELLVTPDPIWWSTLASVEATTLLLYGGEGSHVSAVRQRRVADLLPRATTQTVPEAGHRIHSKYLDRFCDNVLPMLTAE